MTKSLNILASILVAVMFVLPPASAVLVSEKSEVSEIITEIPNSELSKDNTDSSEAVKESNLNALKMTDKFKVNLASKGFSFDPRYVTEKHTTGSNSRQQPGDVSIDDIYYSADQYYDLHPQYGYHVAGVVGEVTVIHVNVTNNGATPVINITVSVYLEDLLGNNATNQISPNTQTIDTLAGLETVMVDFNWIPDYSCYYSVEAIATVEGDPDTSNNNMTFGWFQSALWFEDSEYGEDKWTRDPTGNEWEISDDITHDDNPDPQNPGHFYYEYHTAPNAWWTGDGGGGNYGSNWDNSIISSYIDFSGFLIDPTDVNDGTIDNEPMHIWGTFLFHMSTQTGDGYTTYYQIEGEDWEELTPYLDGTYEGWYHWYSDINNNGQPDPGENFMLLDAFVDLKVRFKITFTSDAVLSDYGVYIDDWGFWGTQEKTVFEHDVGVDNVVIEPQNYDTGVERDITATITNYGENDEVFNVECVIEDSTGEVFSDTQSMNLASGESSELTWAYTPDSDDVYTVTVTTKLAEDERTENDEDIDHFRAGTVETGDVLIIDDDPLDDESANAFKSVLESYGKTVVVEDSKWTDGWSSYSNWDSFDVIILASSDYEEWDGVNGPVNNFDDDDPDGLKDALINWHNNGNRLLMEGGELVYATATQWYYVDPLWADFCWGITHVDGVYTAPESQGSLEVNNEEHPIAQGFETDININYVDQTSIDAVMPQENATSVFTWSDPTYPDDYRDAVVAYDDDDDVENGGQFVLLPLDITTIAADDDKRTLIWNSVAWLLGEAMGVSYIHCVIDTPTEGATVSGTVEISGTAWTEQGSIDKVEVMVEGEGNSTGWETAMGTVDWTFDWDSKEFGIDGDFTIHARAFVGEVHSKEYLVNITSDNDWAPVLKQPLPDVEFDEDTTLPHAFDLDDYMEDVIDHDPMTYSASGNTHVNVMIDDNNQVTFSAEFDWNGQEVITFKGEDKDGYVEDDIVVTVNPVNDAPTITITEPEDGEQIYGTTYTIKGTASDIDANDRIEVVQVAINDETFSSPLPGLTGTDNWEVEWETEEGNIVIYARASDGEVWSDTVSVSVNVKHNSPPELNNNLPDVEFDEDSEITAFNLNDYFSDPDGDTLEFAYSGAVYVIVTINADGSVDFSADENWYGIETITFTARDGIAGEASDTITVTVNSVNDAPTVKFKPNDQSFDEDSSLQNAFDLDDCFEDVDDKSLEYTFSGNTKIKVTINADNTVDFSADENWYGIETITFTAKDGEGAYAEFTITVTVNSVEDEPKFTGSIDDVEFDEDSSSTNAFNLNDYFSDDDGDELTFDVEGNDHVIVNISDDGFVSFSAEPNWNGEEEITFTASDGKSKAESNKVTVTVTPVNDKPTVKILSPTNLTTIRVGSELEFVVDASDVDADYEGGDAGTIALYHWDFDGDGIAEERTAEPTITHKFTKPGKFTVRVYVTDKEAEESEPAKVTIIVKKSGDGGTPGFEIAYALMTIVAVVLVGTAFGLRRKR